MKRTLIATLIASLLAVAPGATIALDAQVPREGIAVHGHWTIDVLQPDGTLVTHTEFENALLPLGVNSLIGLLARQINFGLWSVELQGAAGSGPCGSGNCLIVDPASTATAKNSSNLQLGISGSGAAQSFDLSGSVTATSAGSITAVASYVGACGLFNIAPGAPPAYPCTSSYLGPFTGTTLPTPVAISSGQIMQVKVSVSFS